MIAGGRLTAPLARRRLIAGMRGNDSGAGVVQLVADAIFHPARFLFLEVVSLHLLAYALQLLGRAPRG